MIFDPPEPDQLYKQEEQKNKRYLCLKVLDVMNYIRSRRKCQCYKGKRIYFGDDEIFFGWEFINSTLLRGIMNQLKELGAIQFSYRKRRNGEQNLSLCPREVWRYVRSGAPYYSIRVFEQKFIEVEQLFKDTIADIDSKDDDHPETHDGPEKAGSQTRRTLTLNLVVKEVDDWTRETLCLVCNGKETVLKTFNTTAAKAATIYVLKNPGRVITLQELLNNCKDLEAIKAPRVNDLIRVWPENDDFMKEFIRRVFFRKLSHKDVYFLGKQVITLP